MHVLRSMREHRREELTAQAIEAGHSREYADRIYDLALEEHVDPAVAFDVVLAGLGVRELAENPLDNWEETQVEAPPAWIEESPGPVEAARERHLRLTFRRLRSLLDEHDSQEEALRVFKHQTDVGAVEY